MFGKWKEKFFRTKKTPKKAKAIAAINDCEVKKLNL